MLALLVEGNAEWNVLLSRLRDLDLLTLWSSMASCAS